MSNKKTKHGPNFLQYPAIHTSNTTATLARYTIS
jgi:hypothetical protein